MTTGRYLYSYFYALFTSVFLYVYRLEGLPFLSTGISIAKYSNAHTYMGMRIRNVRTVGHRPLLASERSERDTLRSVQLRIADISIILLHTSPAHCTLFN